MPLLSQGKIRRGLEEIRSVVSAASVAGVLPCASAILFPPSPARPELLGVRLECIEEAPCRPRN